MRLSALAGENYDSTSSESRFFMGDYTSGSFGNNFDVEIDYVNYNGGGMQLPTGTDSDGDGMSDAWEYQHFGNLTSTAANTDADGDGYTNLEEYEADTDPTNYYSALRIQSITESGSASSDISIVTSSQRNYTLYRSNDLGITDTWTAIHGPIAGNGAALTLKDSTNPTTQSNRFYRVEVTGLLHKGEGVFLCIIEPSI